MVLTEYGTFGGGTGGGGGWNLFGEPVIGPEEPTLEEADLENIVDQVKPFWPLLLIPLVIQFWNRFKKREDDVPWEAIARAIAPIVAPIILSAVWVILTKFDKRVDWLANMIAVAEIIPTVDLNVPPGIVLGSMYASAEDVQKILTAVVKAGEKLAGMDPSDIIPDIPQESKGEDILRALVGGEPVGNLILDLVFGKE